MIEYCYNYGCVDHVHPDGCDRMPDLESCPTRTTTSNYDLGCPIDSGSGKYEQLGISIGKLVDEKQIAYGNSYGKAGEFLKLLYPDGIKVEQYQDMLGLVRIFDKQMRIATNKDALGENPFKDIAGYGLLGAGLEE